MEKQKTLSLINGQFTNEEAHEILMNMFLSKIQFHKMKNFSSQERLGISDPIAVKRIPELLAEIENLKEVLEMAQSGNYRLSVKSVVNITILDEE